MMRRVHRFSLEQGVTTIVMPACSKVVHVDLKQHQPQLWVLVPEIAETVTRRFEVVGTGWPIDVLPSQYCGTAVEPDGTLVWHVFELEPSP